MIGGAMDGNRTLPPFRQSEAAAAPQRPRPSLRGVSSDGAGSDSSGAVGFLGALAPLVVAALPTWVIKRHLAHLIARGPESIWQPDLWLELMLLYLRELSYRREEA